MRFDTGLEMGAEAVLTCFAYLSPSCDLAIRTLLALLEDWTEFHRPQIARDTKRLPATKMKGTAGTRVCAVSLKDMLVLGVVGNNGRVQADPDRKNALPGSTECLSTTCNRVPVNWRTGAWTEKY